MLAADLTMVFKRVGEALKQALQRHGWRPARRDQPLQTQKNLQQAGSSHSGTGHPSGYRFGKQAESVSAP